MFVRSAWRPRSDEEAFALIERHPWALLVNNGPRGPYVTNVPLMLDRSSGKAVLIGHLARANNHAEVLQAATDPTLAVFQGPYSYVTSSWYPDRDMPPTYYYTAVHCYGRPQIQSDEILGRWLEVLTDRYERAYAAGWSTSEIEPEAITRRLKAIVGFEMPIEWMEAKFKLGQDEPKKDALAVASQLASDPTQRSLADLICSYNVDRSEGRT